MKMMQRLQENLTPWWGLIISVLLSALGIMVSVCVFFLVRINDKIDYSYQHAVEQKIINQQAREADAGIMVKLEIFEKKYELHADRENERHWELKNDIRSILRAQ